MSNKQYRTPGRDDDATPADNPAKPAEAPPPEPEARPAVSDEDWCRVISPEELRLMLSRTVRLIDFVEDITVQLITTISLDSMRNVVAEDIPLPTEGYEKWAPPPSAESRKRPRGRKHPFVEFLVMVIKAGAMKAKALRILHPGEYQLVPESSIRSFIKKEYGIDFSKADPFTMPGL